MASSHSLTDVLLLPIERPRCARCGSRMNLTSLAARPDGSEQRTFECPKCDFIETMVVPDPLMSRQIDRLADHIRPPA